jgi:hypothetical protein
MALRKKSDSGDSPFPTTFQTFFPVGTHNIRDWTQSKPSSFNALIRVKKYRVTIEEVQEPEDVIIDRLVELYKNADSYRERAAIEDYAEACGFNIDWKAVKEQGNGLL